MIYQGELLAIRISTSAGEEMESRTNMEAIEGEGLREDRYANCKGAFQKGKITRSQQVTLIEEEAIQSACADYELDVEHATTRRNLLTSGVPLNHLVGVEFCVGDVRLRGVKLCEPCGYLDRLTGKKMVEAFRHRGGLRAEVISGGMLRVGDPIVPVSDERG